MRNTENNFAFQRRLGENGKVQNPARIPPQTPPAGGTEAEAGQIHIPSQMFCPAESIHISSLGFSAKYIRTLSSKHRQKSKSVFETVGDLISAKIGLSETILLIFSLNKKNEEGISD